MKASDVVFGVFPCHHGKENEEVSIVNHYSLVVEVKGDVAMLVYMTSIKEDEPVEATRAYSREWTPEEREHLNIQGRGRYDASRIAFVPTRLLRVVGQVPATTTESVSKQVMAANQSGSLLCVQYNPSHRQIGVGKGISRPSYRPKRYAGQASRYSHA